MQIDYSRSLEEEMPYMGLQLMMTQVCFSFSVYLSHSSKDLLRHWVFLFYDWIPKGLFVIPSSPNYNHKIKIILRLVQLTCLHMDIYKGQGEKYIFLYLLISIK